MTSSNTQTDRIFSHAHWWCAALLVLVWFILSYWRFEPAFLFHGDHERDLRYGTLMVSHGIWPESTPSISPTPFELGPWLYFVMAPGVAISADPLIVQGYFLLLASVGFFAMYACWIRRIRPEAALVALFALLSSTFTFEMSRQLWHSSLLPLFIGGFFYAVERLIRGDRIVSAGMIAAACAAAACQLHMTASVYALLGLGLIAWRRKAAPGALIVGILGLIPLLWTNWTLIEHGALEHAGRAVQNGRWSPASATEVLEFFVDNMHMIWGDDIGPLFTWPIVALSIAGIVYGVRTRDRFAIFLCINLLFGFVIESLLLGNQRAHRYMHANIWAAFGLVGYGAQWTLAQVKPWVSRPIVIGLALVITGEAVISEVPHAQDRGWLNTREQSLVARTMAEDFPLSNDAMEHRVHGTYFGETMGMGHYHSLNSQADDIPAFSQTAHVLVVPEDLPLALSDLKVTTEKRIAGNERVVRMLSFEPRLTNVRYSDGLESRWRESSSRSYGPGQHRIEATANTSAEILLLLSRTRTGRDHCNVTVRQTSTLSTLEVATPRYQELRVIRFAVKAGPLVIDIGPCPTPRLVDIF
jgi:hypothetical protein